MRWFSLVWLAVTAAIAGVASYFSYQAGLAAGLATKLPAGAAPYYPYGPGFGWGGGWGFGFPVFGLFWLLFVLFIIFWVIRGVARGGHRGGPGGGPDREQRLRDWHRQAHEQDRPTA